MTIKGSLYWCISMLKRFSAEKKHVVKISSKNGGFRKFKGLNINCGHRDTQKAHPWPERRFWRIFRNNPFRGVGCRELHKAKKALKTIVTPDGTENHAYVIWGAKTPEGSEKKLAFRVTFTTLSPMPISVKIGQRVLAWGGSNFGLFHWRAWSPLQHSQYRASVWWIRIEEIWYIVLMQRLFEDRVFGPVFNSTHDTLRAFIWTHVSLRRYSAARPPTWRR